MDWRKDRAALLRGRCHDPERAGAVPGADPREAVVRKSVALGVERVDFEEWLGLVRGELRALARSRHAVPLVAQAAGVEAQRVFGAGRLAKGRRLGRDETGPAVGRAEMAVDEQALAGGLRRRRSVTLPTACFARGRRGGASGFTRTHRPLHGL